MSFLYAVLLAVAQSQPENPHDVNNKDHPAPPTSQSTANAQARDRDYINPDTTKNPDLKGSGDLDAKRVEKAEKDNPDSVKNKDRMIMSGDLLAQLHAANLEEIQAGQMAMKNGGPRAQEYGRMLMEDHRSADKKLRDLAVKRGVKLDDSMGSIKWRDLRAKLEGKTGAEFDKTFASAMADGHKRVIDMVQTAKASCRDQDVCSMLDDLIPTLQRHLKAAEDLKMPAAQGRRP